MTEASPTTSVLDIQMDENDADAETIRDYLVALVAAVWYEREGFSGKRPFGNSGWHWDLFRALADAGLIEATYDEDGFLDDIAQSERDKAEQLIAAAIEELREVPSR